MIRDVVPEGAGLARWLLDGRAEVPETMGNQVIIVTAVRRWSSASPVHVRTPVDTSNKQPSG